MSIVYSPKLEIVLDVLHIKELVERSIYSPLIQIFVQENLMFVEGFCHGRRR